MCSEAVSSSGAGVGPKLDVGSGLDAVAFDTDVASRYFKGDLLPSLPSRLDGRTVLLPFVTVGELATWPERLLWGRSRAEELCRWVDSRRVLVGDEAVARIWSRITVSAQRAGRPAPVNESWVAASCLSYGLPLMTTNTVDYRFFVERHGLKLL
jgi:predicted nucleic acid-binding protein